MSALLKLSGPVSLFTVGLVTAALALKAANSAGICLLSIHVFDRVSRTCCHTCHCRASAPAPLARREVNDETESRRQQTSDTAEVPLQNRSVEDVDGRAGEVTNQQSFGEDTNQHPIDDNETITQLDDLSQLQEAIYGPEGSEAHDDRTNTKGRPPVLAIPQSVPSSARGHLTARDDGPLRGDDAIKTAISKAMGTSMMFLDGLLDAIAIGCPRELPERRPSLFAKVVDSGRQAPECIIWLLQRDFLEYVGRGDLMRALILGLDRDNVTLIDLARSLRADGMNRIDINADIEVYGSLLQRAIIRGDSTQANRLMRLGVKIHQIRSKGYVGGNCALMAAISTGNEEVVRELIRRGADVSEAEGYWGSALHTSAYLGHYAIACYFVDIVEEVDSQYVLCGLSYTPLEMAMKGFWRVKNPEERSDHVRIMKLLVRRGAKCEGENARLWGDVLSRP